MRTATQSRWRPLRLVLPMVTAAVTIGPSSPAAAQTIARPDTATAAVAAPSGTPTAVPPAPGASGAIGGIQGGSFQGGSQAPPTGPRDPGLQTIGDAAVRGRIVAADSGRSLRRATVRISGAPIRGSRSATTDADGRYEFANLPAGSYILLATRSGYVSMGYRQPRANSPPRPLVLAAHQSLDADIALPPGGVISGRVLDEFGEPVANVTVNAERSQYINGSRRLVPSGGSNTNDLGEFRLFGLAAGDYVVATTVRNFSPGEETTDHAGYAPTYYPSTSDAAAAQKISVRSAQTVANVDVMLVPTRVARITGSALDASGAPARGGSVMVQPRDSSFQPVPLSAGPIRPDGTFALNGIAPGEYVLRATLGLDGLGASPSGPPSTAMVYVTVNGVDIANVILQQQPPPVISGRITGDPTALAALRPGAARVAAVPVGPSFGPPPQPGAIHDDYSFEIPALPGPTTLRSIGPWNGALITAIRLNGRDVSKGLEVQPGTNLEGVEIEVALGGARVTAVVVDSRNQPVIDADVLVFSEDETDWGISMPGHAANGRTDDKGQYQSPPLLPGRYYVAVVEPLENGQAADPEYLASIRSGDVARVVVGERDTVATQFRTVER